MAEVDSLERARKLPAGARFYKCALQVNPFGYLVRHHKATPFTDEHSYNEAMVAALRANGIEVIAITAHVASAGGGLLRVLKGTPRINVWACRAHGLSGFTGGP